jgi:hypothetical protein
MEKDLKTLTKKQLIEVLVKEYGHEEKDIKTLTNGKLIDLIKQEQEDMKEAEKPQAISKPKQTKLDKEYQVLVMNGTYGQLQYISDVNGSTWKFTEYGQTDEMNFGEIQSMLNRQPTFIKDGWLVILDDQVIQELRLQEYYKHIYSEQELDDIFAEANIEKIREIIKGGNLGIKTMFAQYSMNRYKEGKLHDFRIIRLVQEELNLILDSESI